MRKFIVKTILFVIPLIAILTVTEAYIRNIPNSYKYKYEFMENNGPEIRTLVLGSSHAYRALNPEYLPMQAFSLAYSSQDLKRDLYLLERFIGNMDSLEYVIQTLSYHTIPEMMEDIGQSKVLLKYYSIYMDYPGGGFPLELTVPGWTDKVLMHLKGQQVLNCDSLGFGNHQDGTARITEKEAKSVLARHTHKSYERVEENTGILERTAELTRSHNAKLIIVTTPVIKEYYGNMNQKQYSLMVNTAEYIEDRYDNVVYINLINDSRFDHSDFRDPDHLNSKGAKKFSKIISDTIQLIYRK